MPHQVFKKWIYSLITSSLVIFISACSDGGSSSSSSDVSSGRTLDVLESNVVFEGASDETQILVLEFLSPLTGNLTYESFNMTAAEKSDYRPVAASISVVQGETYGVSVEIYGDDEIEGDEQFGVRILDDAGVELMVLIAQISNDDLPGLAINTPSISEGDIGTARLSFTLELSDPVVDSYEITISSENCDGWVDTSTDDERYATPCVDFEALNTTLVFNSGVQELSFDVVVISDDIVELDELVVLSVTSGGADALTVGGVATGTIRTDETPNDQGFSLSTTSLIIKEDQNNSGADGESEDNEDLWQLVSYKVGVVNPENIIQAQYIEFTLKGEDSAQEGDPFVRAQFTADSESDYCVNNPNEIDLSSVPCTSSGRLLLEPGTESFELQFYVSADEFIESDEVIELALGNDQGVDFTTAYHTIENDDAPELIITVDGVDTPLAEFVEEGSFLTVVEAQGDFVVNLKLATSVIDGWDVPFHFRRATGGNINADSEDYIKNSGTLTFTSASQEPTDELFVVISHDTRYEGDEFFELYLEGIGIDAIKIKILDNDLPAVDLKGSDGSEIITPYSTGDFGGVINFSELVEQEVASNENRGGSVVESNKVYQYKIFLGDDGTSARSDLTFKYRVETLSVQDGASFCSYLDTSNVEYSPNVGAEDYKVYIGDPAKQVLAGVEFEFTEGEISLPVDIEIINDSILECDEYLAITFYIVDPSAEDEGANSSDAYSTTFKIPNKDQALLKVSGWETSEGSDNVHITKSFTLSLDQAINTNVPYTLSGNGFACNTNDIKELVGNTGFEFNTLSESGAISVAVQGDDIVEPLEICELSISSPEQHNEIDLYEIQYCDAGELNCKDENESEDENEVRFAEGVINNNDLLEIKITTQADSQDEPVGEGKTLNPFLIEWNREIAANVGAIELTIEVLGCEGDILCLDSTEYKAETVVINADDGKSTPAQVTAEAVSEITVFSDEKVELTEELNIDFSQGEGAEYISTLSNPSQSVQIENKNKLSLSLQYVGSTVPVDGESGYLEYLLGWGDVSVNADAGELSLNLNVLGEAIRKTDADPTTFDYVVLVDGKDYVAEKLVFKAEGSELPANETLNIKIQLNNDELVEIAEDIHLEFTLPTNSPYLNNTWDTSLENTLSGIAIHTIVNDDFLTLTISADTDGVEGNEGDSVTASDFNPFTYAWDKSIAANVPSIELAVLTSCVDLALEGQVNSDNCAEANDFSFNENIAGNIISIHAQGEIDTPAQPEGKALLTVVADNRVEADEDLILQLSSIGLGTTVTNVAGQSYIETVLVAGSSVKDEDLVTVSSSITNDDTLSLQITQSSVDSCNGFVSEAGCQQFTLSWSKDIDTDVGAINLNIDRSATTAKSASENELFEGVETLVEPQDYKITLDQLELTANVLILKAQEEDLAGKKSKIIQLHILEDEFVEPIELVQAQLVADSPFINTEAFSDNTGWLKGDPFEYTIPLDDRLTLSFNKESDINEPSADLQPYSVSWLNPVAKSTANIAIELAAQGCEATSTVQCATINDDFTLNTQLSLHSENQFTPATSGLNLAVTIKPDNIVEFQEEIKLAVSADSGSVDYFADITQPAPYLIGNDDTATLTLTPVDDSTSCNSEACSLEFDINWDKGFAKELPRLSLDLSTTGTGIETSDYTFTLASCNFSADAPEVCETALTDFEIMPGDRVVDTLSGSSSRVAIHIKDDDVVEIDETLTLTLDSLGANQTDYTIKGDELTSSYIIENDDFLTLTISSVDQGEEGDLDDQGDPVPSTSFDPFTYAWDKEIAANVPTIQLAVMENCAASTSTNCAEINDYHFSAALTSQLITIHEQDTPTAAQTSAIALLTVESDNRVEGDEDIYIQVSTLKLETFETNEAGRAYVLGLVFNENNVESDEVIIVDELSANSQITNDDKVQLSFTKTSSNSDISDDGENGFLKYQIDWQDVEVDDDVTLSLDLTLPSDAKAIRNPNDTSTDFDYTLKVESDTGAVITGNSWLLKESGVSWDASGSSSLYIQLNNDSLVELEEKIEIQVTLPSDSHEMAIKDESSEAILLGTVEYTIPVADTVQLSILKDDSNTEISDENSAAPKSNNYTVTWDSDIASDVPDLTFSLGISADDGTEDVDFTYVIQAGFVEGVNTLAKTAGSFTFSTSVFNDTVVELGESFTTTLSVPTDDANNATYLTLVNTEENPNSFTHTITDTDKVTLKLTVENSESQEQEESIDYTISWLGSAEANVDALTFNLDVTGDVTFEDGNVNNDYKIISSPFAQTGDEAFVLKAKDIALTEGGSATLTLQVQADDLLEIDETLTATLSSPLPSDLLELDNTQAIATHTILNDDFLTLTINGLAQQSEPTTLGNVTAYSVSWNKAIELPVDQIPSVSLIKHNCTGINTLECLDDDDYSLVAGSVPLTLSSTTKSIDLPLSLKPDDLVELPEKLVLQFNVSPTLVEKIKFAEDGTEVIAVANSTDDLEMNWDLTVISEDRLTLSMGTSVEALTECESGTDCPSAQTVNTLTITGDVATNGPTITLQTTDICDDAVSVCAQSTGTDNGGVDYVLEAGSDNIVLHTYNEDSVSDIKSKAINITPQKDEWVEVDESIQLQITPNDASKAYLTENWKHEQNITLTSADVVAVSLARDSTTPTDDNGLCSFESASNIVESNCTSQFNVLLTKSIAKEVADISVNLTANLDTDLKIKAEGEEQATAKFDVIGQYGDAEIYPTSNTTPAVFNLAIHSNDTATVPDDAKAFKLLYQDDGRIEIDESIQLVLGEGTGSQYTVPVLEQDQFTINETLKNDDFLVLTISGSNAHDEPDANVTPYTLSWNGELDENITVNISAVCTQTETQKCLSEGATEDYTFNTLAVPLIDTTDGQFQVPLDLTLLPKDGLVEFPEVVNLQLVVDSELISGVVHDNGGEADIESINVDSVSTIDWTLTVNNTDKLTLEVTDSVTELNENCPAMNGQSECVDVATVSNVQVTGAIATNGPTLNLITTDICSTANTNSNSENCAILNGKKDSADGSEIDYEISDTTAVIALNGLLDGAVIPIELTLEDDSWVEITETIKLKISPDNTSLAYINQIASDEVPPTNVDWSFEQNIDLTSEDKADMTVSIPSTTCIFETDTFSFVEKECVSTYGITLTNFIAKEVPTVSVNLSKDASTNAEIKTEAGDGSVFDVSIKLADLATGEDAVEQYFTGDNLTLPIHTNLQITEAFNKAFTLNYTNDDRVELSESIELSLKNLTSTTGDLFSVPDGVAIAETIVNDDVLELGITGSTSGDEGDTGSTQYTYAYAWDLAVDADVGNLTFQLDFDDSDNSATLSEDYDITYGASSPRFTLSSNLLTLNMSTDLPALGTEEFTLNVTGDELVEVDETIKATLSIDDSVDASETSQTANLIASIDSDNNGIDHTIQNNDEVIVTLYSSDDSEGSISVFEAYQPFSYTIDKDIADNVPTIELLMSLSCIDSDSVNCVEYETPNPDTPESNDFSYDNTRHVVTVHTIGTDTQWFELVTEFDEDTQADIEVQKAIVSSVPITVSLDSRVEAHESLIIKFNKEDGQTNEPGRAYIKELVASSAAAASEISLTALIENDDKLNIYITQTEDNCELTAEDSTCDFEVSWFNPAFDLSTAPISESDLEAIDGLTDYKDDAKSAEDAAYAAANIITGDNTRTVDEELSTRLESSLTQATAAYNNARTAIERAQAVLDKTTTLVLTPAVTYAEEAATAAQTAATEAQAAATAATNAATAAQEALIKAYRADQTTRYETAEEKATLAIAAAENATTQAYLVIASANGANELAEAAIGEYESYAPNIDIDAGEISLVMTNEGSAKNTATLDSTDTSIIRDPQDYKIELEDVSGGTSSEQTNGKIILKDNADDMESLPRTLTLAVRNDDFMEPDETIAFEIEEITDGHEFISELQAFSLTSTIDKNDSVTVDVTTEVATEGLEAANTLTYNVVLSNEIAKNVSAITLNITPVEKVNGKIGEVMGADSGYDFSVSHLTIHNGVDETLELNKSFDLIIIEESMLELDELVKLDLSLIKDTQEIESALTSLTEISYTIENDDTLLISVTADTSGTEGTTAGTDSTLTTTNKTLSYALTVDGAEVDDAVVAANYPPIVLTYDVTGSTASSGADFTPPSNFTIHDANEQIYNAQSSNSYAVVNDRIVEKPEDIEFIFNAIDDGGAAISTNDVAFKVNASETATLSYTITNDDYIHIDFQCGGASCDGDLTEDDTGDNHTVQVVVDSDYESQGLSDAERTPVFTVAAGVNTADEGTGNDYELVSVSPLTVSAAAGDFGSIITVNNDSAIEKTETFTLALAANDYMQFTISSTEFTTSPTVFTITNDDYLTVNSLVTEVVGSTSEQDYNIQVCNPSDEDIEGGDFTLTTTLKQVEGDAVNGLTCDDIVEVSGNGSTCFDNGAIVDIETTLSASAVTSCTDPTPFFEFPLFTLEDQTAIKANQWFNVSVTTDNRCDTTAQGNCHDATDVVVFNNQLTNVLDTGLTQCLQGSSQRWAVDCATLATDSAYLYQDAAQTGGTPSADVYPDLAYTYVGGDGKPVTTKPISGEVCVQDNNTGFIWSGTILNSGVNTRVYNADVTGHTDYDCGLSAATWQLPTVQDLMTIMDVEKLKMARELDIKFVDKEQADILEEYVLFYENRDLHSARYWTSDACDSDLDAGTIEVFTLNFISGELLCSGTAATDKNSMMMLYK